MEYLSTFAIMLVQLKTVVLSKEAIQLAFATLPGRPASRSLLFAVDVETGVK
jgi:hypothetical protein